jgi:cell division protein FtsW
VTQTLRAPRAETTHRREHPMTTYYLLLGSTILLLLLGLAMVLSASTIVSYNETGSAYTLWFRQVMFAIVGVIAMFAASRMPVSTYRKLAYPLMLFAVLALLFVLFKGHAVGGQKNWIVLFGPFRFQPSEFAKLAFVLWAGDLMCRKQALLHQWKHLLVPVVPVGILLVLLVLAEGDFGTAMIIVPMVGAVLLVNGAPMRLFAIGTVGVLALVAVQSTGGTGYRQRRYEAWLHPEQFPLAGGYQLIHARAAMGSGGWFGMGLGASREKWVGLPESHTDFIYAVVGEELGLFGSLLVIGLFTTIVIAGLRLARQTTNPFVRTATAAAVAWIFTQVFLNLGAVIGLIPITGVPLPLVSYGGSSLVPTLFVLGMLMSFARAEAGRPARESKGIGSVS